MNCIICNNNTNLVKPDVYKCNRCKHIFIDYKESGLDYHKNEYRKNGEGHRADASAEIIDDIFTEQFHQVRYGIMNKRCNVVKKYFDITVNSNILDIGAGGGTFAKTMLSKLNTQIDCQEISEICIKILLLMGFNVYQGNFNDIRFHMQYDLVTCWHALEHIKDLYGYAEKLASVSKDTCILEVPINRRLKEPNNGSWDGHYHFFTEKSITHLFGEYFSDIQFSVTESIQQPALLVILKK